VLASPAMENFLGITPDLLLGRRAAEIFPADHPLREVLRVSGDLLEPVSGAEVSLEGIGGGAPGRPRRVGVNVHVIEERGTRMGALVLLRDLESLERIGSQLQVSERLAAIGRVTAGVAHEVKNPLNSMRLWLENLKETLPADQELPQQAVKILDGEIDRLDRVVKTFLDFSRPVEIHLEETSLSEVLEEIMAVARPQIQQAGIEAKLEVAGGAATVLADRQLLKQAILNLVLNACEVMQGQAGGRPGKLTINLKRNEQMAELRVADTGPGISPENRRKIFQLFFTTRAGGSGIGLATTFRIVQMHNGSIDFETEVGRGTTFRIELPLAH
jgi:signal transduction histidine kinase